MCDYDTDDWINQIRHTFIVPSEDDGKWKERIDIFGDWNINYSVLFAPELRREKYREQLIAALQSKGFTYMSSFGLAVIKAISFENIFDHIAYIRAYKRTYYIGLLEDSVHCDSYKFFSFVEAESNDEALRLKEKYPIKKDYMHIEEFIDMLQEEGFVELKITT
ncbi:MAG: hypothetical protein HYW78_00125 [Parcubacteria group bacterium]|nr:hypothetical protein [Parcubacteria group bacterium]